MIWRGRVPGGHGIVALLGAVVVSQGCRTRADRQLASAAPRDCAPDNGGLVLPQGFCATVFADSLGHARH
ncbi:MAG TPA: hypothetical protein VFD73_09995, partial [Gemmatimonadales bacterium]|nr:hypothetical protein [Gemmatimonadales bacterium]